MNYIEDEVGMDRSDDPQTIEDLAAFGKRMEQRSIPGLVQENRIIEGSVLGSRRESGGRRKTPSQVPHRELPDTEVMKIRVASHPSVYV